MSPATTRTSAWPWWGGPSPRTPRHRDPAAGPGRAGGAAGAGGEIGGPGAAAGGRARHPLPDDGLKRDLQALREEIQQLTRDIGARLKGLEPGKEEEDENRNTIGARVKRTQHGVLSQQFLELTGRCHAAQARYRQRSLERVRRQLQITGNSAVTDEELEEMLETGQSEVFVSNVLGAARATRAALDEVTARHQELLRLERGLRELGELFMLLGTTVEGQGEVIDRIEKNILESGTCVRKGHQHLGTAREHQRGARRKKLLVAACVFVTVLIVAAIIAATAATG
ncbi:syntaxin-4-like [Anas platyrhynchos]|uniref:syntaxin-4-like n=1 Tax=Anas platyrhynchos TaxID=8839 RepID=UPI003AF2A0D9